MVDDVDAVGILIAIPLFSEVLSEAQIRHLAGQTRLAVFPNGVALVSEGDFGDSMFAIVKGTVAVSLEDRRGAAHGIATLGAGDIVGEMSLMTGARRNATVVAETDVIALEITKVALEQVFARAPELIDRFGSVLGQRQAERDRVAADAATPVDLAGRIRRFFGRA